jgi:5-methylcytosine-specific restriction endonuclease McrA
MKKRRSAIWKCSKNEMLGIIQTSNSISEVLGHFGLQNKGSNHVTLKQRLESDQIDWSVLKERVKEKRLNTCQRMREKNTRPIEEMLVKGQKPVSHLKNRVRRLNLLKYECLFCGNTGEWQGKSLSLQLDHENGDNTDNRLENLRFLCPNCHSQTKNYAGKNKGDRVAKRKCSRCNARIVSKDLSRTLCRKCRRQFASSSNGRMTLSEGVHGRSNRPEAVWFDDLPQ